MKRYARVDGLIWIILGIGMCIGSIKLKLGNFHAPGPGFLPFLSGLSLAIFGLILAFSRTFTRLSEGEEAKNNPPQFPPFPEQNHFGTGSKGGEGGFNLFPRTEPLRDRRKEGMGEFSDEKNQVRSNWRTFLNPLLTVVILLVYILLLEPLGFLLTTFVCLLLLFKLSEPKKWLTPLVLSVTTAVLSYLLFSVWLQCQFPKGLLRFL